MMAALAASVEVAKRALENAGKALQAAEGAHASATRAVAAAIGEHRESKQYYASRKRYVDAGNTLGEGVLQHSFDAIARANADVAKAKANETAAALAVPIARAALEAAFVALPVAKEAFRAAKENARIAAHVAARVALRATPRGIPAIARFLADEFDKRAESVETVDGAEFRARLEAWTDSHVVGVDTRIDNAKAVLLCFAEYGIEATRTKSARTYTIPWETVRERLAAAHPGLVPDVTVAEWLAAHYDITGNVRDTIGAFALRDAYLADTGDAITSQAFGREMATVHGNTDTKKQFRRFGGRSGWVYLGLRRIV